ncbi:Negative regulator of mitotic exit [Tulasnella sp. 408]|nr:Negative regulator of mitotic exit [Tulasnella sp. 408]
MFGLFSSARHHRPVKTKDAHSPSASLLSSSSQTRAQREREGDALGGSPSQQQHIWSSRDRASPPTNNQLQPPPPPREREREPYSQSQQPSQFQSAGHKTSPTGRPAYPWSARRLVVQPASTLIRRPGPPTQSPSPFPRYGHSLPAISASSGELFLFGGLVKEQIKNDLYSISTRDLSVALIETKGEIPPPRVGHASALVSSVLIVWGGDTKTNDRDRQDDALYLLHLGTREWTRFRMSGRAPPGRCGHAVTMCGTRFFVFGGQVDGEFLNDLWAFDLSSLKTPDPNWDLYSPVPGSDLPARRTGHVCVAHSDKLYMFGGTDRQYHYNDTWCFDVPSRTWRELTCIGFIPVPREGHAAALVDDVIYIFGGRGIDGKELSDLAAFKISNSRWYMFQYMGPSPSGRSGHAMAASGTRVFVLGGESFTTEKPDDPSITYVLDTRHIKYPDSNRAPPANAPPPGSAGRWPSVDAGSVAAVAAREQQQQAAQQLVPKAASVPVSSPPTQTSTLANVNANLQKENARDRAMSPPARDRALSPSSTTSKARAMSSQEHVIQQESERSESQSTGPASSTPPLAQRAVSPTNKPAKNASVSVPLGSGAAALANDGSTPAAATATTTPAPTSTASSPSSSPQLDGSPRGKPRPRRKRGDNDLLYGAGLDKNRSEEGYITYPDPSRALWADAPRSAHEFDEAVGGQQSANIVGTFE